MIESRIVEAIGVVRHKWMSPVVTLIVYATTCGHRYTGDPAPKGSVVWCSGRHR